MTGSLTMEEVVKEQSNSIFNRIAMLDRMTKDAELREKRRHNESKRKDLGDAKRASHRRAFVPEDSSVPLWG